MRNNRNRRRRKSKVPKILAGVLVLALVSVAAVLAMDVVKGKKEAVSTNQDRSEAKEESTKSKRPDKIETEITKIKMIADKRTVRVGDSIQLSVKITPEDATYQEVIWTSSNDEYVEITEDGQMIPKEKGANHKVKITATADDGSDIKVTKMFRILPKIDPEKPMVAITYDDGPHPTITDEVLDALEENNAVATFFMLGENIPGREDIIKRSKNLGNELCSHAYDHPQLTKLSGEKIKKQMSDTDKLIEAAIGQKAPLMRPPYGAYDQKVRDNVGKPMILWSVDTLDWEHKDSNKTYDVCMTAKDGDIILMHDIQASSGKAAGKIYRGLQEKGFQLVTVSEMYESRGQKFKNGGSYFSMPWSEVEAGKTATSLDTAKVEKSEKTTSKSEEKEESKESSTTAKKSENSKKESTTAKKSENSKKESTTAKKSENSKKESTTAKKSENSKKESTTAKKSEDSKKKSTTEKENE
ncbi:MAG: polysaccharide deacetylase family protein [Lachnospiraceae bacterium]